ncbi:hypothetical protein EDC90_10487 [Martelella mediterranea]|uniref:Uncharacterized protein n=1 Tax=Martelella mediterranea TaxID=293089 RepID=A0A4R3NK19_9HYPH|nr:hypothetical protein EDC90_10487 [Martelella mediterranea]
MGERFYVRNAPSLRSYEVSNPVLECRRFGRVTASLLRADFVTSGCEAAVIRLAEQMLLDVHKGLPDFRNRP